MTPEEIIEILGLLPLEMEGGFFRETYRSDETYLNEELTDKFSEPKGLCTAIYFLLTPHTCSKLHRLPTDEIYHFYLGDPVDMLLLHANKEPEIIQLGHEINSGQHVQIIVPRGTWQGSFLREGGTFALMGTTMSPGFDFSDFEAGDRDQLIQQYPERKQLIKRLT